MDKLKILIIDDDKFDRMHCRRLLEENKDFLADIVEADNAEKGIKLTADETIDCILLDYFMPVMDGIGFAKYIRNKHTNASPIIMLTGQGNEHIAVNAMKEGVKDYAIKNELNSHLLTTLIMNTINGCKLEKQLIINRELEEKNHIAMQECYLKNEFLENMSHELRTPLNVIIGLTDLLNEGDYGYVNEEQKDALNNILDSSKSLLGFLTNVIDITEMDTYKIKFHPLETDLTKLVSDIVNMFQASAIDKSIKLTCSIEKGIASVYMDPYRFKQILNNYLSNAIKFTPPAGQINVRIKSETDTTFRLEVEDNGIGIKDEDLHKLFTTFQQLDSSPTKKYAGTGLGLALVKHITEMQGGTVGVKSIAGVGSVFYAIIPRWALLKERG